MFDLVRNTLTRPGYARLYLHKMVHAFEYAGLDYRFLNGYSLPPKSVCLVLTDRCNLKCSMCDIGRRNAQGAGADGSPLVRSVAGSASSGMTFHDWTALLNDLAAFRPRPLVLLTGTEPLLYQDLCGLLEHAVRRRLAVHITTNGTLLAGRAEEIARLCRAWPLIDITVSIDALGCIHDEIRGVPGTFDKAVEGIRRLDEARRSAGTPMPSIQVTCTVTDRNYEGLEDYAAWFVESGMPVDSITFNHLWFRDDAITERHNRRFGAELPADPENISGVDIAKIDMDAVQRQIRSIRRTCAGTRLRIFQQPELSPDESRLYYSEPCRFVYYRRCTAAWRNVTVTPAADVILSPLCFLPPVANLQEQSFSACWNSRAFTSLRRRIKKEGAYPACSRCCMLFGSKPGIDKLRNWLR